METNETLIIGAFISIALYSLLITPLTKFYNFSINIINHIKLILYNNTLHIVIITLVSLFIIKFIYSTINNKLMGIRYMKSTIIREREKIKEFLKKDFRKMDLKKLELYINNFQKEKEDFFDDSLRGYLVKIGTKFLDLENMLVELKHKDEMEGIEYDKYELLKEIEELEKKKKKIENYKEFKKEEILEKLNVHENFIFKFDKLKKQEVKLLKEQGYKQINEYCVLEKKIITVLISKILNHSYRHSFLVWSVRMLLRNYPEITNIREHDTRDADLTFNIGSKKFAIEIETGSLLRKKKQLMAKIGFLKRKYRKRWIILVSNRDSLKHYKKFGLCSQRKDMIKNLEKLIGI